jgi:hypothetical protein
MHLRTPVYLAALSFFGVRAIAGPPERIDVDWIAQRGGSLELKLAHEDKNGPDGGLLKVDPARRLLLWEGIEGELGCKLKVEASFDDVKSVRSKVEGGFTVELRRDRDAKLVFMPLPDAPWLGKGQKATEGTLAMVAKTTGLRGPDGGRGSDGSMMLTGDTAFAGLRMVRADLPPQVTNDINTAVTLIRNALGRAPSPSGALQEALHGQPIDVSVEELLEAPVTYLGHTVRLRGRIQRSGTRAPAYRLVDDEHKVVVTPLDELSALVGSQVRSGEGLDAEITGVLKFQPGTEREPQPLFSVAFWEFYGPGMAPTSLAESSRQMSLKDLAAQPGRADGHLVRVIGKFRGRNLYGDLPDKYVGADWVIKDGKQAVVIKGKRPAGPGFKLDPYSSKDAASWLEVVGRPETHDGVTTLHAVSVALAVAPPSGQVQHPTRLRGVPGPTVMVFALPVEGDQAIAADTRFVLQFSAYMDEDSFDGRVRLRYADGPELPGMTWRYEDDRRALIINPGEPLAPGRQLELLLLPGIRDTDGALLVPRSGDPVDGAVERLHYEVGS